MCTRSWGDPVVLAGYLRAITLTIWAVSNSVVLRRPLKVTCTTHLCKIHRKSIVCPRRMHRLEIYNAEELGG